MDMKNATLAIATDDGRTVSSHFGRAQFYEVVKMSGGNVQSRERRPKPGHHAAGQENHELRQASGESHEQVHQSMVAPVMDCDAVIARGMGEGALQHILHAHLTPIVTGLPSIDEVIAAVASGALEHDPRRVHQHHGSH